MLSSPLPIIPIRADSLFPRVCVDSRFVYKEGESLQTRLQAIKDAEDAYLLYASCRYLLPPNFSVGLNNISALLGKEVTRENVRRLRRDIEKQLGLVPKRESLGLRPLRKYILRILSF
jgi:hypothetical protein